MSTKMYFENEELTKEWTVKNKEFNIRLFNFKRLENGYFSVLVRSEEYCKILEDIGATQSSRGSYSSRDYDKVKYNLTANQLIEFRKRLIGTDPYERLQGRTGLDYVVAMEESVINFIPED